MCFFWHYICIFQNKIVPLQRKVVGNHQKMQRYDKTHTHQMENGVLILNIRDFLINENSLPL